MTSEIAVLNRFGIALAADSAVTVEQFHDQELVTKTYNSANKLFTLSKHAPVAIMFYNTVTLGGVPWETIIKSYREQLGRKRFPTLDEYCKDFFSYLEGNLRLFPIEITQRIVGFNFFREIRPLRTNSKNKVDFRNALERRISELEKVERIIDLDADFEVEFTKEYKEFVDSWITLALPTSYAASNRQKLLYLAKLLFSRKQKLSGYSGIVVAGFGEDEYLPKLRHFLCDCVVSRSVRRWLVQSVDVSDNHTGQVVPLADSEVSETLVSGINPRFKSKAYDEAFRVMLGIPDVIVANIPGLTPDAQNVLKSAARKSIVGSFADFYHGVEKLREEQYEAPINRTISSLPIAELGPVAETFINASHIHKRVNPGFETVGGPVDVAVVSKGDGFVWVKRKHYFDGNLNPTFALRYVED